MANAISLNGIIVGQSRLKVGASQVWRAFVHTDQGNAGVHVERRRWRDGRTVQPVIRKRLFGLFQANNPDVRWVHEHATATK